MLYPLSSQFLDLKIKEKNMAVLNAADRKSNNILYMAMCFGLLSITAAMYYLVSSGGEINYIYKSLFFSISAVFLLISILLSSKVYSTNINKARERTFDSYEDASANFRAVNVVRWAMVYGASIIALVLAFLESNLLGFVLPVIGLLFLYVSKINEEHFKNYKIK